MKTTGITGAKRMTRVSSPAILTAAGTRGRPG